VQDSAAMSATAESLYNKNSAHAEIPAQCCVCHFSVVKWQWMLRMSWTSRPPVKCGCWRPTCQLQRNIAEIVSRKVDSMGYILVADSVGLTATTVT